MTFARPPALVSGARLAIVAPASPFRRDDFEAGLAELRALGFEPVWDERVFARRDYVAGPPEHRAACLRDALRDPSIAGVVAVRGGYGSAQLLPWLDAAEARAARKALVGYSDVTALLSWMTLGCGVTAFHGPMIEGRFARGAEGYDRASFLRAVGDPTPLGELAPGGVEILRPGEAAGVLLGGTLTQLLASLGTPWAFDPPAGTILFVDEVGERPYRLDRMFTQLRHAGVLGRMAALVFGELPGCDEPGGTTARATVADLVEGFPGPVLFGFPSGHTAGPAWTLPFGVEARVVATGPRPRLVITSGAVAPA